MATTQMEPIIFQGEGAQFTIIPYGANGLPDMFQAYNSEDTIVQSITRTGNISVSDILDSNGNVAASRSNQVVVETTIQMGAYDPKVEAIMSGTKIQQKATGAEMYTVMADSIPTEAPYEITFEKAKPLSSDKIKIEVADGTVLALGSSSAGLAQGQFFYDKDTGKITFAEQDKGKKVIISYFYDGKDVTLIGYENKMKNPTFMLIVRGTVYNKDETQAYYMNFAFDRSTNNGNITPPTQQSDPTGGWQINIKSLASRAGKYPITIQFEPVVNA